MRGIIESFDERTGDGVIRALDGSMHAFARSHLLRRSRAPRALARVIFRMRNGEMLKVHVVSHKREWSWLLGVGEALLYLPLMLSKS